MTTYFIRMVKSKNRTIPTADKDEEQQQLSFIAGVIAKWYSHLERHFASLLHGKTVLPPDSPVVFLGIYTTDLKKRVHMRPVYEYL